MDWADQFFILLGAWFVCAVVAYLASRSGHRWRSRLSEFAIAGSGVGLALALVSHALWFRVWSEHQANVSPTVAQSSWRLFRVVGEYAPLSGALAGGMVGCVLAYALRRTNAA